MSEFLMVSFSVRVWLMVLILALAGCGAGGGASSSSGITPDSPASVVAASTTQPMRLTRSAPSAPPEGKLRPGARCTQRSSPTVDA